MTVKILVVDDHGILRAGVDLIIGQTEDMEVVGQAANGRESIELAAKLKPDVILMDVSMPELNGISATELILNENPDIKVLALSAHANGHFVKDMLKAGASGYLLKDGLADELVEAVRTVSAGRQYLCKQVTSVIINNYLRGPGTNQADSPLSRLTEKERQLLQLLTENKTSKEAARILHVSVKTVDARRRSIMEKLGIDGIAALTKFAVREGLTSLDF